MPDAMQRVRSEIVAQLNGGNAHATLEQVVADFPAQSRGTVLEGLPYSAWQLLEHIRLAQEDILKFVVNADGGYVAPNWPDDYWPSAAAPPTEKAWDESVRRIQRDRDDFAALVTNPKSDLLKPFPWGDGQTLLREAFLIVDHTAYHLGEIVTIRRMLGIWK